MGDIEITKAAARHIDVITAIAAESKLCVWSREDYLHELSKAATIFEAAEVGKRCVGFIVGRLMPEAAEAQWVAELYNIGVEPTLQGKGIGSCLIRSFNTIAAKRGAQTVYLEVRAGNQKAIDFYKRHGFEVYSSRPSYYRDPPEDAILMRARIEREGKQVSNKQLE